jgi:outer membrane receptor for ferrienterochelin and colicins
LNAGAHYDVNEKLNFDVNLFRNDIDNLIQVDIIAFRSNAAPVYSYFNVKEAYTQGAEINSSFRINKNLQLQGVTSF